MAGRANVIKVAILGDSKGLVAATSKSSSELSKFGAKAAKVGLALGVGFAAVGAAAAVGLYKVGESFDEAYDHIRIGTGATGAQLAGLKKDFRQVVQDVPTDFGSAAEAITDVSKRLGLTGKPLKDRTEQFLELSRITKTDLGTNITNVTGLFNNFGVGAARQGEKLDLLFRASQQTGISVGDLSSQMGAAGVTLRAAGLDFNESAVLLAGLNKAGISANAVMPAIGKALATAAKEGKPASKVFSDTFAAIKNAPTDTKAAGIALDVFGAKAGPKLAAAIREGKLNLDDLQRTIVGGKDTIRKAGTQTQDFAEKWQKFKNRVLVSLAPLAGRVFNALGTAMDKLPAIAKPVVAYFNEHVRPVFERLGKAAVKVGDWFKANWPQIKRIIVDGAQHIADALGVMVKGLQRAFDFASQHKEVLVGLAVTIGVALTAAFYAWASAALAAAAGTIAALAPVIALSLAVGALVAAFIYAYKHFETFRVVVQETLTVVRDLFTGFVAAAISLWQRFGATIVNTIRGYLASVVEVFKGFVNVISGIFKVFHALFTGDWSQMWAGIQQIWRGAFAILGGIFRGALTVLTLPFRLLQDAIRGNVDNIAGFFAALPGRIGRLLKAVATIAVQPFRLVLNGIVHAWNNTVGKLAHGQHIGIPHLFSINVPDLRLPTFHKGGVADFGPAREGLAWLRNGEHILTPEQYNRNGGEVTYINHWPAGVNPDDVVNAQRRQKRRTSAVLSGFAGAAI